MLLAGCRCAPIREEQNPQQKSGGSSLVTVLLDYSCPQAPRLDIAVCPWSVQGRLNHDQLGDRIDANVLSLIADQGELTALPVKKPKQIAIAKQLRCFSGQQISVRSPNRRGLNHPLRWNDLFSVPRTVMSEQAAKARVVTQRRIKPEMGKLESFGVQQPLRVGFSADRFPYSVVQILGCRSVEGVMKHQSQDIRFDACVMVPCPGWCYATIELHNTLDCTLPRPGDHVTPESIEIASTVPVFPKVDSRRHMEEIPDRGHPKLATPEARHIGFGFVVDRFNRSLGDRNTNQYTHNGLDHRLRD